jgi:hypothetical protein
MTMMSEAQENVFQDENAKAVTADEFWNGPFTHGPHASTEQKTFSLCRIKTAFLPSFGRLSIKLKVTCPAAGGLATTKVVILKNMKRGILAPEAVGISPKHLEHIQQEFVGFLEKVRTEHPETVAFDPSALTFTVERPKANALQSAAR